MDWSNERYVRVYTRDTTTWKLMDWRAHTVLLHLFRKVDRAGVLDVGDDGVLGLAAVLELPIEIVESGIAQLCASRGAQPTVIATGSAFVLPRFIEAQEAPQSDVQRQRELRARRRDQALATHVAVTFRDGPEMPHDRNATNRDLATSNLALASGDPHTDQSRNVTLSHETSRDRHAKREPVTPSLASIRIGAAGSSSPLVPIEREITHVVETSAQGRALRRDKHDPTPAEREAAMRVLVKLSEYSRVTYRGGAKHVALIARHLRDGITEPELKAIVALKATEWEADPKMRKFLRPETLFGPDTIERYLDPARTEYAEELAALEPQTSLEVVR